MIVLAVLFGAVVAGVIAIGLLALRASGAAGVLSATVARASKGYRESGAGLRESIGRSGAGGVMDPRTNARTIESAWSRPTER